MRKFKFLHGFYMAFFVLLVTGCEDILEEDISNEVMETINPISNDTLLGNTVNFSWLPVEGADNYRLQVQDHRGMQLIDSLVPENSHLMSIDPGNYFWKIRAENFAYNSNYSEEINFTMLASDNLIYSRVVFDTPTVNFSTNQSSIIFNWESVEYADSYRFQVRRIGNGQETILDESGLTENSYTFNTELIQTDGDYLWRVKASNQNSETNFTERKFILDRQAPGVPQLSEPSNQFQTPYGAIEFKWQDISNTSEITDIYYDFEISDDVDFSNIIFAEQFEEVSVTYTFEDSGTYYWRVRALDKAGNFGDFSNSRSLILE